MTSPVLLWLRRDLRLADHPALHEAASTGRPVIPVVIRDAVMSGEGAAARLRLDLSLEELERDLRALGSRITYRTGAALDVLAGLARETGARDVFWSRRLSPDSLQRDREVRSGLVGLGLGVKSFNAELLREPWAVMTAQGRPYSVFTPFWKALRHCDVPAPLPSPPRLVAPGAWPLSEDRRDWRRAGGMGRWAAIVAQHQAPGEQRALQRLACFFAGPVRTYREGRDRPDLPATSGLSEHLACGEISPRQIWHAAQRALHAGAPGAGDFLRQVAWREFAWHLLYHSPQIATRNWRRGWEAFPWRGEGEAAERWRRGMTGEPFVDAAMREMHVTGRMHNRARMIAASYLTKHLLVHWKIGLDWFAEHLTDWDPASNALGWQWVAGSGPDAAPYFRIFNPALQALRFDPQGRYRQAWIAEGQARPGQRALAFFDVVPRRWGLVPGQPAPQPLVTLAEGRARALEAYGAHLAP